MQKNRVARNIEVEVKGCGTMRAIEREREKEKKPKRAQERSVPRISRLGGRAERSEAFVLELTREN